MRISFLAFCFILIPAGVTGDKFLLEILKYSVGYKLKIVYDLQNN